MNKLRGSLSVALAMLIFGSMGIFARFTGQDGLVITFFASLFAALGFFTLIILKGKFSKEMFKRQGLILLATGLLGVANNATYFYSFNKTTIAQAVFLHNLAPIWAVILATVLFKEKMTKKKGAAIFLALAGLFLVSGMYESSFNALTLGNSLALISAIAYGTNIVVKKKAFDYYDVFTILLAQMVITTIVLSPYVIAQELAITTTQWLMLLAIGIGTQFFAVILHIGPLKYLKVSTVAMLGYLEPLFATLLAYIILSEIQGPLTLIGGALIILSTYFIIEK